MLTDDDTHQNSMPDERRVVFNYRHSTSTGTNNSNTGISSEFAYALAVMVLCHHHTLKERIRRCDKLLDGCVDVILFALPSSTHYPHKSSLYIGSLDPSEPET
jgi:hypothetical protein